MRKITHPRSTVTVAGQKYRVIELPAQSKKSAYIVTGVTPVTDG